MGEPRRRRPDDPYYDLSCAAGTENLDRLFIAEMRTMADNRSKDSKYRRFRKHAIDFIERHYTVTYQDALIPYMAMTYVDRIHFDGKIPDVVDSRAQNNNLFLVCCLIISWKLRTKRFVLQDFLNEQHLTHITVSNVIEMESKICKRLDWRLRTVTPFWFIDFFGPYLIYPCKPSKVLRHVCQLIVKAQCAIVFTEFRPSVIAVSAIQIVAAYLLPGQVEEFKKLVISEWFTTSKDQIRSCIMLLEKLYHGPTVSIEPAPVDRGGPSSSAAPRRSEPIDIPIPQPTSRKGKEVACSSSDKPPIFPRELGPDTASDDLHMSGVDEAKEGGGAEIQMEEEGDVDDVEEGGASEIQPEQEGGVDDVEGGAGEIQPEQEEVVDEVKEGRGGEIQPEQEEVVDEVKEGRGGEIQMQQVAGLGRYFQDEDDTDELMKFPLRWREALAEVNIKNLDEEEDGSANFLTNLAERLCACCCVIL